MDRRELLDKLHLSDPEFRQMLHEFSRFYNSLNHKQQRVVRNSMLSLAQAAKTYGDDVTEQDLAALCGGDGVPGICGCTAADGGPNQ